MKPRGYWQEKCISCGCSLTNQLMGHLIEGPEFSIECPHCEKEMQVHTVSVPEFCLTDKREHDEYEKKRIQKLRKAVEP